MEDIIRNPRTVKGLANEIIKVCDGYWARKVPEAVGREYIVYWSIDEADKLFKGNEINSTIKKIIGKKRIELLGKWLEGTQIRL